MEIIVHDRYSRFPSSIFWQGEPNSLCLSEEAIRTALLSVDQPCYLVDSGHHVALATGGQIGSQPGAFKVIGLLPAHPLHAMGDPAFLSEYGLKYPYVSGAMANGIASEEMVIAMGCNGMLGSFGAAGLSPQRVEAAIHHIQAALPDGPYAFNLIHSPAEESLESKIVDLYIQYGIRTVEASAFLGLTPHIVRYRVAGLSLDTGGEIRIHNRVIAKVSRKEVAIRFLEPAPEKIIQQLLAAHQITDQQAEMARCVPMADDITIEADSGGHTDNRPLVCLIPSMLALRDDVQSRYHYNRRVRIGAAGGISTPAATLAAFSMGAAYVLTGSINQACVEAGASAHTRKLLAQASMTDVTMAPAADMFEMGVKVQLLKTGTLFPMRAQKLYELYTRYDSIDALPPDERQKLETQVFKSSLDEIWSECERFFTERDPQQIVKAVANPKRKMALIFRWYLGLSSRWSAIGEPGREMDYQIWCGPGMGSFNDWVKGTYLAESEHRHVADIALHLLIGAAYQARVNSLRASGVSLPENLEIYRPINPLI